MAMRDRAAQVLSVLVLCLLGARAAVGQIEIDDLNRCGSADFHGRHVACLDAGAAKLTPEDRHRFQRVLVIMRQTMTLLDNEGRDVPAEQQAFDDLLNCGDAEFYRRHVACFDRRVGWLPADKRARLKVDNLRESFFRLEESERESDRIFQK